MIRAKHPRDRAGTIEVVLRATERSEGVGLQIWTVGFSARGTCVLQDPHTVVLSIVILVGILARPGYQVACFCRGAGYATQDLSYAKYTHQ